MDQDDGDNNNNYNKVYSRLSKAVISSGHNYVTDPQITNTMVFRSGPPLLFGDEMIRCERDYDKHNELIKTQIANHPSYPDLLAAYIQCQKVYSFNLAYMLVFFELLSIYLLILA